jgi:hypothetical protein
LGVSWQLRPILDFRSILALSIGFAESRRYIIPWPDRSEHHVQLDPVLARSPSQSRAIDPLVLTICKASVQIRSDRCSFKKKKNKKRRTAPSIRSLDSVVERPFLSLASRSPSVGRPIVARVLPPRSLRPLLDPIAGSPAPRRSPSSSDTGRTVLWRKNGS